MVSPSEKAVESVCIPEDYMNRGVFLVTVLFLFSCGSSADKRLVAKIDTLYKFKSSKSFVSSKNFTAPMAYAAGQYVVTGTTDDDGERSISRITIIGKSGRNWIFEFYTLTYKSESSMQICMSGIEKAARTGNMDAVEILWIKTMDTDGNVQKHEGSMLLMMKAVYKTTITSLQINTSGMQNGGVLKVPAGIFEGTKLVKTESSFMGKNFKSTVWYHSAVPINGMVKSMSDDKDYVTELLDFGFKGSESLFK